MPLLYVKLAFMNEKRALGILGQGLKVRGHGQKAHLHGLTNYHDIVKFFWEAISSFQDMLRKQIEDGLMNGRSEKI